MQKSASQLQAHLVAICALLIEDAMVSSGLTLMEAIDSVLCFHLRPCVEALYYLFPFSFFMATVTLPLCLIIAGLIVP